MFSFLMTMRDIFFPAYAISVTINRFSFYIFRFLSEFGFYIGVPYFLKCVCVCVCGRMCNVGHRMSMIVLHIAQSAFNLIED